LAARLVKDQTLLTTLTVQKEELQATVDAAKAQCAALYTPENLLSLIQSKTPEANDVRLRLRAEILRRISRIDIDFNATFNDDGTVVYHQQDGSGRFVDVAPHQFGECAGPLVRVQFVNGTERLIILDGDKAILLWTA
jgi:hypothetical protein